MPVALSPPASHFPASSIGGFHGNMNLFVDDRGFCSLERNAGGTAGDTSIGGDCAPYVKRRELLVRLRRTQLQFERLDFVGAQVEAQGVPGSGQRPDFIAQQIGLKGAAHRNVQFDFNPVRGPA